MKKHRDFRSKSCSSTVRQKSQVLLNLHKAVKVVNESRIGADLLAAALLLTLFSLSLKRCIVFCTTFAFLF